MRFMREFWWIFLAIAVAAVYMALEAQSSGAEYTHAEQAAANSLVNLQVPLLSGRRSYGSGVLIDHDTHGTKTIVTNAHVVTGRSGDVVHGTFASAGNARTTARVTAVDRTWDLAVLIPDNVENHPGVRLAERDPAVGTAVVLFGTSSFPCRQHQGLVLDYAHYPTGGQVPADRQVSFLPHRGESNWMRTSTIPVGGDSGGAIFTLRGRLAAILWGSSGRDTLAVKQSFLRRILSSRRPEQAGST